MEIVEILIVVFAVIVAAAVLMNRKETPGDAASGTVGTVPAAPEGLEQELYRRMEERSEEHTSELQSPS